MPRILTRTDIADFRDRLCEAATAILVERGHAGFNMRELAARLGVSAMTPYRYFEDKEEILATVRARAFGRFADHLEAAYAAPGVSEEKSDQIGRAFVQFALEEQIHYRLMFDLSQPNNETVPELARQEQRARDVMTEHARSLVDRGFFAGDPELIGRVFWAALHGTVTLLLADRLHGQEFERLIAETLRVVVGAYRCGPCAQPTAPAPENAWHVVPMPLRQLAGHDAALS